jgi:hypothetical protein
MKWCGCGRDADAVINGASNSDCDTNATNRHVRFNVRFRGQERTMYGSAGGFDKKLAEPKPS